MPNILLAVDDEFARAWGAEVPDALRELGNLTVVEPALLRDPETWASVVADVEIAIVSWSFPELSEERLVSAPRLRLVVNAASSVRFLFPRGLPDTVMVTQAGQAMVPAVAEASLLLTMLLLRAIPRRARGLSQGEDWHALRAEGESLELASARIGVVGASRIGREYIALCERLGARPLLFDPYVPCDDPLLERCVPLDEIFSRSDVVVLHAPLTNETRGMVGMRQLALMRDGAGLVNTARAGLIDADALFGELESGRLVAALDVFEQEPLPPDSRWRTVQNLFATPHVAGKTRESRRRAGEIVVDEVRRFVDGEPLVHVITPERFDISG